MAIQIQGYQQTRQPGSPADAPTLTAPQQLGGTGRAIQQAAQTAMDVFAGVHADQAEAEALNAYSALRQQTEEMFVAARETAQPGADKFTPEFLKSYKSRVDAMSADMEPLAKERFARRAQVLEDSIFERALGFEAGERQRYRIETFEKSADAGASTLFTVDGQERAKAYTELENDLLGALVGMELEPGAKQELARKIRAKLSYAGVQGDLRDRPATVQDWLIGGTGADYYSKLRSVESGGRNIQAEESSAFGPYQFTKGTWAELIKAHPELGLTEADRYNPQKQEIGIRAFTGDNAKVLRSIGYAPSNANLYMLHFLGVSGGPRFLKALKSDPTAEARQHVTAEAVAANPSIFREGRSLQEVYALFGRKFGMTVQHDQASGAPAYYADLSFEHRDALYSQAETEMNKRRTDASAAFKQRADNALAEVASNGSATDVPGEAEFVAAFGPERGTLAHGEFMAGYQAAKAGYDVQRMSLAEMSQYAEQFRPEPGDPFFAEKLHGYNAVRGVVQDTQKRIREDFGAHFTGINPDARQALAEAMGQDPEAAKVASRRYVALADSEAARLGIRTDDLLPQSSVDAISSMLDRTLRTPENAAAAVAGLNAIKQRWGDAWPRIHQAIKAKLSPAVHVLTADGIPEHSATLLASVHDKSFQDLTKTLLPADRQTVTDRLADNFAEYAATHWGGQTDVPAFFEQAKKLAAVYAAQGTSPDDAADRAYSELIGGRFAFEGGARIPAAQTSAVTGKLEAAKAEALTHAVFDTLPVGVSDEDARNWVLGTVEWRTLPSNRGLVLVGGMQVMKDASGRAIVRTWEDLKKSPLDPRSAFEDYRGVSP